jgi:hypothetical protein
MRERHFPMRESSSQVAEPGEQPAGSDAEARFQALVDAAPIMVWQAATDKRCTLPWKESGGPVVKPPERTGFGSILIEHGLKGALGGTARMEFRLSGLLCRIAVPCPRRARSSERALKDDGRTHSLG